MKKTILQLVALAIVSLFCCSCEEEKIGAYPYSKIFFIDPAYITINHSTWPISKQNDWDSELYPMEFWVEETEMASVDNQGYVTGHKLGTFTLHAKVMGKHGWVESSQLFTVGEEMSFLTPNQIDKLISLGVDKNNDGVITTAELEQTEDLNGDISSNFLFLLQPYLHNLKRTGIVIDTITKTLDLKDFNLNAVKINDQCLSYATSYEEGPFADEEKYLKYQPYFCKNIILNNCIESLTVEAIPGIKLLDLSEYTNLKTFSRSQLYTTSSSKWDSLTIILPQNIEEINIFDTKIIYKGPYPQLRKITYNASEYVDKEKNQTVVLEKQNFPNLRNLFSKQGIRYLDISSYEALDFDEVHVLVDSICLSQSLYDARFLSQNTIYANKYIIK